MPIVICPECDAEIFVDEDTEEGYVFTCEECGTELKIIGIEPFEVDVYDGDLEDLDDDDLDDDDDDDFDDFDDEDEKSEKEDDYDGYGEDDDHY